MTENGNLPDSELQTISPSGDAPETRVGSARAAYTLVHSMILEDGPRELKRAQMQRLFDGAAPYDKAKLKQLGQSYRSNTNFRESEGYRDARRSSYYELIMEVPALVKVKVKNERDPELHPDYEQTIAEEFTTLLREWDGFLLNTLLHQQEMIQWGMSNVFWQDSIDWRFKALRAGKFLVPAETPASIGEFEMFTVRSSYRANELFAYVRDDAAELRSKAAGWDTDYIKQLLINMNEGGTGGTDTLQIGVWSTLQQKMKDNDLMYGYSTIPKIKVDHLFVQEFDGKVSHFIIAEDAEKVGNNVDAKDGTDAGKFIFKSIGRFVNQQQVTSVFFSGIGDGTYHSLRGLGHKIFAHCTVSDRMLNTAVDGAMIGATILVSGGGNEAGGQKARLMRVGPITRMPDGYEPLDTQIRPALEPLVSVRAILKQAMGDNVGLARPDVGDTQKTPQEKQTLGAVRAQMWRETKLENMDIEMYYGYWDRMYQEVKRRVMNPSYTAKDPGYPAVKEFFERCVARNVPRELITADNLAFSATRAIGMGSPQMRDLISSEILGIAPYFDEAGKKNAVADRAAALVGYETSRRYIQKEDRNKIPTKEHAFAGLENNDLREGSEVIVAPDQEHVIHAMVHLDMLMSDAQAFVDGQSDLQPEALAAYFGAGLNHTAIHLDYLKDDPLREVEHGNLTQQFESLVPVFQQIQAQAQQAQQQREAQAQQQQQLIQEAQDTLQSREAEIEALKLQQETQIKVLKEQNNQAIKEVKASNGMQIKNMVAEQDMRLKEQAAATDRRIKELEAAQKLKGSSE